jgi:type I restriction enzyme S subunit
MRDGWLETNLGKYIYINTGKLDVNAASEFGEYPFFTCSRETYRIDEAAFEGESVLVAGNGDLNVKYFDGKFNAYQRTYVLNSVDRKILDNRFLFLYMQTYIEYLRSETRGTVIQYLKKGQFTDAKIKLPPLPEQKRIVDLISAVDSYIESLQYQLESAKRSRNAVLYKLLTAGGNDWVESTLGEIANWGSGGTPKADNPDFYDGEIPWCVIGDLTESEVWETEKRITNLGLSNSSAKVIDPGSVLLAMYGASIGRTGISAIPMATNQAIAFAKCHPNLALPKYLLAYLQTQKTKFVEMGQGAAQPNISQTIIKSWPITLPPIPYQSHLVSTMEVFDTTLFALQSSINSSKLLRSSLLSDLLSGEHEIPVSYDKVMGAA